MNGNFYDDGTQFKNPKNKCEECKCVRGNYKCYTLCSETKESCLAKSNDQYTYNWYEPQPNECCGVCNKTKKSTEKCEVVRDKFQYISSPDGRCKSKDLLPVEKCAGGCESYESSYIKMDNMVIGNKVCKCCSVDETHTQNVTMICGDKEETALYFRIKSCKCNMCGAESKIEL